MIRSLYRKQIAYSNNRTAMYLPVTFRYWYLKTTFNVAIKGGDPEGQHHLQKGTDRTLPLFYPPRRVARSKAIRFEAETSWVRGPTLVG